MQLYGDINIADRYLRQHALSCSLAEKNDWWRLTVLFWN